MTVTCPVCKQPVVADYGPRRRIRPHNVGRFSNRHVCRGSHKIPKNRRPVAPS